jgi:hypothetical protein
MTIPFPGLGAPSGWVCPKCGRVYAPWVYTCGACAPGITITFPPSPPSSGTAP